MIVSMPSCGQVLQTLFPRIAYNVKHTVTIVVKVANRFCIPNSKFLEGVVREILSKLILFQNKLNIQIVIGIHCKLCLTATMANDPGLWEVVNDPPGDPENCAMMGPDCGDRARCAPWWRPKPLFAGSTNTRTTTFINVVESIVIIPIILNTELFGRSCKSDLFHWLVGRGSNDDHSTCALDPVATPPLRYHLPLILVGGSACTSRHHR